VPGIRIPARELEALVTELIAGLFADHAALAATLRLEPVDYSAIVTRCSEVAQDLQQRQQPSAEFATMVRLLPDKVEIDVSTVRLGEALSIVVTGCVPTITLTTNVRLKRSGGVIRIVVEGDGRSVDVSRPQASLIKLVAKAHSWWKELAQGEKDVTELARLERVTGSYVTRVVRLAFLSPATVEAVMQGRQGRDVTSTGLTISSDLPMSWSAQASRLI
jgi:hypothetical protein